MLRDITIGQHFPGNSVVHRCDPRLKIIATIAYIIVLFMASNPLGIALSLALLALLYKVAQIPIKLIVKSLKPIVPIVLFTAVLNLFFITGEGEPLVHFGFIHIYREGVSYAVLMAVRIVALIAGTSLLTYTTSPIVLTDAIEALLKPFAKLHLPVHELAMMMTIALRFIPLLIDETEKIMNAQKARGAMLDNGKFMDRIKALVPVLIPLFISAFRRADELAMAMECRCYHGGEGRTKLSELHYQSRDYLAYLSGAALLAVMIVLRQFDQPVELFRAADAPGGGHVTDGPFLIRRKGERALRMIWSNFLKGSGYCVLQCVSESGSVRRSPPSPA